jgi:exonuclease SbcD
VFLAPGNHDWYAPDSIYRQTDWTPNVHIFTEDRLVPVRLEDGITLWGAAHRAPANTDGFLDGFRVEGEGVHLALFHGSERSWFNEQGGGKAPHGPFEAWQIEAAGLQHAFLGHYHRPLDAERHTYPGNPEPLTFGEDGPRGVVLATVLPEGRVEPERVSVSATDVYDGTVDISGCASRTAIRDLVAASLAGRSGLARIRITGELPPDVELWRNDFADFTDGLEAVKFEFDVRPGMTSTGFRRNPLWPGNSCARCVPPG